MSLFPLFSLDLLLKDLVLESKGINLHFSKKDQCTAMINSRKLEEFEAYFEVLEMGVFHEMLK